MTQDSDLNDRIERLESIVERQQETIETLRTRLVDDHDDHRCAGGGPTLSRRTALKAGGLAGLLALGTGAASADPQGQIGTSSDPLTELYTEEVNGGVTGDTALTSLTGTGLAIDAGALGIDSGGVTASELATPFADLATLVGSPVAAGGTIDLGGNAIIGGPGNGVTVNTDGGSRALELGVPGTDVSGNTAGGNVVAGHPNNAVTDNAVGVVIGGGGFGGGGENTAGGNYATVGGGSNNTASSDQATVGGGIANTAASGENATVGGGANNTASGTNATVGGGANNTASGTYATVWGGAVNTASGDYSFAAGRRANTNGHDGAFVFGDSTIATVFADADDEAFFQMPVNGNFSNNSSRSEKTDVEPISPTDVLEGVLNLEVNTWEYTNTDESRHIGPMAEDFDEEFGFGRSADRINTVDADGVAFAAIQGLAQKLDEKDERNDDLANDTDDLSAENDRLRERNAELEARLDRVEAHLGLDVDCQRGAADD